MTRGYPRADGRKGIRNTIVVAYLVECAHHVARALRSMQGPSVSAGTPPAHLLGGGLRRARTRFARPCPRRS